MVNQNQKLIKLQKKIKKLGASSNRKRKKELKLNALKKAIELAENI